MEKPTPLFTIITATYNSAKVIERCIDSVLNQTYGNFEYLIIDGKSADDTINIVKKYNDPRIKWISEPDSGIYDAWNKGVKIAKGEWITFIGSDDVLYPTALNDYFDFISFSKNLDAEFISSKMHLVNNHNKIIRSIGAQWIWEVCRLENTIAHPGCLHNRSLFKKYGLFNTSYKICADHEFLLRTGEDMKSAFMNKFTVKMATGGISSDRRKLYKEHYDIAITVGKLNVITAKYHYLLQLSKYFVKTIFNKFGIEY